jgi:hypothetical protein
MMRRLSSRNKGGMMMIVLKIKEEELHFTRRMKMDGLMIRVSRRKIGGLRTIK